MSLLLLAFFISYHLLMYFTVECLPTKAYLESVLLFDSMASLWLSLQMNNSRSWCLVSGASQFSFLIFYVFYDLIDLSFVNGFYFSTYSFADFSLNVFDLICRCIHNSCRFKGFQLWKISATLPNFFIQKSIAWFQDWPIHRIGRHETKKRFISKFLSFL
jgi:hypothetical protein